VAPDDMHSVSIPRGVTDTTTNCFIISVQLQMQPCKAGWKPPFHSVIYPYMHTLARLHTHTDRHLMCTMNFHKVGKDKSNSFKSLITITAFFIQSYRLQTFLESWLTLSYLIFWEKVWKTESCLTGLHHDFVLL